jgi:RES domain
LLNTRTPTGPLYRIAWGTEPWEYPDWKRAGTDSSSLAHTFGNRFDDPNAEYRVLYAASQLVSCYVEVLARFRPDYALLAELRTMDGEDDYQQIGIVPDEWFENRFIGTAEVEGNYADLYSPVWVSHLRLRLHPLCVELGLPDFDVSVLIQAAKRIVTQRASSKPSDTGSAGVEK